MAEAAPRRRDAIAALGLLGACRDQTKLRESGAHAASGLAAGPVRQHRAQADSDARAGVQASQTQRITIRIQVSSSSRTGLVRASRFYVQEMAPDDPRRVMSERMFSFKVDEKRGIVETVYTFTEPLRWRDGQRNIELFTSVVTEDVQSAGCELLWKKSGEQFSATHDAKLCHSTGGAAPGSRRRSSAPTHCRSPTPARAARPGGRPDEAYYIFRKAR